jgi:hypothetical protein
LLLPGTGKPELAHFQAISPDTLPSPSPCTKFLSHSYPVGNGSAAIRRTIFPNSRRVRWLSASSSQVILVLRQFLLVVARSSAEV